MSVVAALWLAALVGCAAHADRRPVAAVEVETVGGETLTPLQPDPGHWHCLVFVTIDCPIANKFAPEIAAIARDFAQDPIRLVLVHVDPEVDAVDARAHAREFGLSDADIVLDTDHQLVRAAGATITPEAAVIAPWGERVYLGRIDDRFGRLGSRRPEPNHRDLRNALRACLRGDRPDPDRTEAIGCIIADFR